MAEHPDGADTGRPAGGDPLSELARALTGAYAMGSAMLGNMAAQPELARAAAVFAPLAESVRRAGSVAGDAAMAQDAVDVAGFLGQTWMVAATSGFRYWRRLAEMYGDHQTGLLQALVSGRLSENDRRAVIDELRTYVRELGDVSVQEARVLQGELERLSNGLAASVDAGAAPPEHRRRWRAKP